MTVLLAAVLAALHLEDNHLVALHERVFHFGYYFRTFYGWCTYRHGSVVVNEENLVKLNGLTFFSVLDVVDEELLALLNLELLTVNLYDCVHLLFVCLNGFFREASGTVPLLF